MSALLDVSRDAPPSPLRWFAPQDGIASFLPWGFRIEPGGVHLSKTMMLRELVSALEGAPGCRGDGLEQAIVEANLLGKRTGSARRLAFSHLNTLYGLTKPWPVQAAMLRLWQFKAGRPALALLCALAREPLLRATARTILQAPPGTSVCGPDLENTLRAAYPGRYSPNMIQSLARNCASSWTQSGHLKGRMGKRRTAVDPSPEAVAYAALLGSLAGFGGPALLRSPWMAVLDRSEAGLLTLLRRAESAGLVRVRAGGGVIQVDTRTPLSNILEVPELADR